MSSVVEKIRRRVNGMDNKRLFYGVNVDWNSLPKHTFTVEGLPDDITSLRFRRVKNSHKGIGRFRNLKLLVAFCVNQDCLDEIATLPSLHTLYVDELSATDLTPLRRCHSLRRLVLKGGTKVPSLDWVHNLPPLESLLIENFKLVRDLSALSTLKTIQALGVEGSMWTTQKVFTFSPLAELTQLQAVFITNCRSVRDSLKPFHALRLLKLFEAPGFYPDEDFLALRSALPQLECSWFEQIDRHGSIKVAIKAMVGKSK
jgi:hypothetical protein